MPRIALLAVIWGWSFLFIKVAVEGMTPSTVAAIRIALGAITMLAVQRARSVRFRIDRRLAGHFLVQGVVASAVPFTLLAWGEQHISSALTAVLNATTPLFAAAFAALALHERLQRAQIAGIVLGFAGVAVAAGLGGRDLTGSSLGGTVAAVAAAACYGLSFAYARRYLSAVPPMVAATGQLLGASLVIVPIGVVTTLSDGIELSPTRLAAIAVLGVVGTGLAYLLNYQSIAAVGPTRASIVTQLVPVVAVAVGVAFLDEPFRLRLVAGGALTLLGIALLHERLARFRPTPARV